jgi:uncharacterized membrane protein
MTPAHGWGIIALAGLAASLVLHRTWRRLGDLRGGRRAALVGLRACAVAALALMVVNPVGYRRWHREERPRVVVLVDDSASMTLKDAPGGLSRIAWAAGLLRPGGRVTAALMKSDVRVLLFADGTRVTALPIPAVAGGPATDIEGALGAAFAAFPEGPPAAIVALTDGAANRGAARDELVAGAARHRAPIYCVGVGSQERPKDAWVGRVTAPLVVRAGTSAAIRVSVGSRGLEGQVASVSLQTEGMAGSTRRVSLAEGRSAVASFALLPQRPGLLRCTVKAAPLPGEWTQANNARSFFLRVVPGRQKLLVVAGQPSRELKFLRRALEGTRDLRVTYLIRTSASGLWQEGDRPSAGARLPSGEALNGYDAVVLADVPRGAFSGAELERLASFVRTRGGGLGILGGANSFGAGGYGEAPLAAVLGVAVGGQGLGYSSLPAKIQPTPEAAVTSPTSDIVRQDGFPGWGALPFLAGLNAVSGVKPGATVLLRSSQGQPLLVVERAGSGRTLCWLSDSTYRWVFSKDATPASRLGHGLFWAGVVAWLTTPPNRSPVALETDRDVYESGDTARVIVQVIDPGFGPVSGAEVSVSASGPGGATTRLQLAEVAGARGRYEAGLATGAPGSVTLTARAGLRGRGLGGDSRPIVVEPARRELADPAQDVGLLRALADASGGAYVSADRTDTIAQVMRPAPVVREGRTPCPWARSLPGLAAFLALAGLDWLLRRLWGVG